MAKKRIWDNFEVIGEVKKSEATRLVVAAAIRDGYRCVNVREFYLKKSTQEWKPARDGINVPILVPLNQGTEYIKPATDLIDLLLKCCNRLPQMELLDEEKAVYTEDDKK